MAWEEAIERFPFNITRTYKTIVTISRYVYNNHQFSCLAAAVSLRRITPISHNYPTVEAWGAYLTLNLIYRPLAAYSLGAIPPPVETRIGGVGRHHPVPSSQKGLHYEN